MAEHLKKQLRESGVLVSSPDASAHRKVTEGDDAETIQQQQQELILQLTQQIDSMAAAHEKEIQTLMGEIEQLRRSSGAQPLSAEDKKRASIMNELIHTERSYLDDIIALHGVVLVPLATSDFGKDLVKEDISPLVASSQKLLDELQKSQSVEATASILSDFIDRAMTPYSTFASVTFAELTAALLKNSKSFAAFRKKVESDSRLKGLPLEACLIKPIQRICRYPLLLGEMLKATPAQDPARDKLAHVISKFDNAVLTINEIRRESEMMNRALAIGRMGLGGMEDFEVWGKRRLLREDVDASVSVVGSKGPERAHAGVVWMFTDCVVLAPRKPSLLNASTDSSLGLFKTMGRKSANVIPLLSKGDVYGIVFFSDTLSLSETETLPSAGSHGGHGFGLVFSDQGKKLFISFFKTTAIRAEWKEAIQSLLDMNKQSASRQRARHVEVANRTADSPRRLAGLKASPDRRDSSSPPPMLNSFSSSSARRDSSSPVPVVTTPVSDVPTTNTPSSSLVGGADPNLLDFLGSDVKDEILEYLNT